MSDQQSGVMSNSYSYESFKSGGPYEKLGNIVGSATGSYVGNALGTAIGRGSGAAVGSIGGAVTGAYAGEQIGTMIDNADIASRNVSAFFEEITDWRSYEYVMKAWSSQ